MGTCLWERRRISFPAHLGYGARGVGKTIPPNSALVFYIRLIKIERVCEVDFPEYFHLTEVKITVVFIFKFSPFHSLLDKLFSHTFHILSFSFRFIFFTFPFFCFLYLSFLLFSLLFLSFVFFTYPFFCFLYLSFLLFSLLFLSFVPFFSSLGFLLLVSFFSFIY